MILGNLPAPARLLRGFATDFLTSHDRAEAERIMAPGYRLSIGGHLFDGRDGSYLPATCAQLEQFPGLCVTVHDVMLGQDCLAMRFTEHGVSTRNPGRAAAWGGITLFRIAGGQLAQGWAEEDYFARKRQLKSGICDSICAPHPAPWDGPVVPRNDATEQVVSQWLEDPAAVLSSPVVEPILAEGPGLGELIRPSGLTLSALVSAGPRAAFHVECHGAYAGGFDDIPAEHTGIPVVLMMAGLADVAAGQITRVQLSADRLGLHRALLDASRGQ